MGALHSPKLQHDWNLISDCLMSYLGHSLVEASYPSAEKQSVYSKAQPTGQPLFGIQHILIQVDWLVRHLDRKFRAIFIQIWTKCEKSFKSGIYFLIAKTCLVCG